MLEEDLKGMRVEPMEAVEAFISRVWMPTILSLGVVTVVFWTRLSAAHLGLQLLSTLLLTPMVWGVTIGKRNPPHPVRSVGVGALTGLLTQLAPHLQEMWYLVSHARSGQGDDQLAAGGEALAYIIIGVGAIVLGGLMGLVVTGIERVTRRLGKTPAP